MADTPADVIGLLEEALSYSGGTHTLEDVFDQIERGDATLFRAENAVIVAELRDTPQMRVVHFWLAAGKLGAVKALSDRVLEWARGEGCTRATLAGRRGWERALPDWSVELVLMGREV